MTTSPSRIPTIDVAPLVAEDADPLARDRVARELDAACREHGFFSVVGHGVDPELVARLLEVAREFFALEAAQKSEIAMARGGRAWRGWFPLGGELTSGVADAKEGLYFGSELEPDDPRVRAGVPLHGPNLFPRRPAEMRETVLGAIEVLGALGRSLVAGLARGLGLPDDCFSRDLTRDPTILFRMFRYPGRDETAAHGVDVGEWGVAEHTDYGLLTILVQDDAGGLEVRGPDGWIEVDPRSGALVCNLGDMLERMTGGRYRATAHRVRAPASGSRIACPCFFDPGWDAEVHPLPLPHPAPGHDAPARWDGTDLAELRGTYGEYLLAKVSRVFPALGDEVL